MTKHIPKPSLGIILTQKQQFRAWFRSDFTKELKLNYNVSFFIESESYSESSVYDETINLVSIPTKPKSDIKIMENTLISHKDWPSFQRRVKVHSNTYKNELMELNIFKSPFTYYRFLIRFLSFKLRCLSRFCLHFSQKRLKKQILKTSPLLPRKDLFILVSNMNDFVNESFVSFLENSGIPWIQVVENWDNLSSKLCPSKKSHKLLVWGNQTKHHAVSIHNIKDSQIQTIGSLRLLDMKSLEALNKNTYKKAQTNFFYIGCGGEYENLEWIDQIYKTISSSVLGTNFTFTFRPHPNSIKRYGKDFYFSWPTYINLNLPTRGSKGQSDWPDLNVSLYGDLLKADLVIGSPSTFLIEALQFQKYIILDIRDDGDKINSPAINFKEYTHLAEIYNDDSFERFENTMELENLLNNVEFKTKKRMQILDFLLFNNYETYAFRLSKQIDELLSVKR